MVDDDLDKCVFSYAVGDLVELGRYGYSPINSNDMVIGTVVGRVHPTDYYVPRYKVRIQYKPYDPANALDEFVLSKNGSIVTVMEYDIAGKKGATSV